MATFTVQTIVDEVRRAVQDTSALTPRYSDIHITGIVNQVLKRIALLRPDLYAVVTTYTCTLGAIQTTPTDCFRLVDVLGIVGGANVNEINRETLDLLLNNWQVSTTLAATDWMRHVRNPSIFFLYPPSPVGQQLILEYCKSPATSLITDVVPTIADVYFPCVVDGAVWLLESVDNEHVNSGRAKMMQDSFMQMLGMTVQTKPITDNESGGQNPKVVY